jgi:hypothetical protein
MARGRWWVCSFGVGWTLLVVGCDDASTGPHQHSPNGVDRGLGGAAVDGRSNDPVFTIGAGGGAGVGNDCLAIVWDSRYPDGGAADSGHTDRGGSDSGRQRGASRAGGHHQEAT